MRRIPHDVKKISQRMMPVSDATPEVDAPAAALKRHVAAIAQAPRNPWQFDRRLSGRERQWVSALWRPLAPRFVAAEQQSNLIVMGVRGRGAADLMFFGSTTQHVVRRAACPVLTLRRVRSLREQFSRPAFPCRPREAAASSRSRHISTSAPHRVSQREVCPARALRRRARSAVVTARSAMACSPR